MICPNCQTENDASSSFCIQCGTPLQVNKTPVFYTAPENHPEKKPKKNIKKWWPVLIVGILIGLGWGTYKMFFNKPSQTVEVSFDLDTPVLIKKNDKYGYVDTNGKVLIQPVYTGAQDFHGNYAFVIKDSKEEKPYQMIDREGNTIMSSKYSLWPKYIEDYKVWIIKDNLYDENLKQLSVDNSDVDYKGNGYFVYLKYRTEEAGIMNAEGKVTYRYELQDDDISIDLSSENSDIFLEEDYRVITIRNSNKDRYAIINCKTGKLIYNFTNDSIRSYGNNLFIIENENDDKASEIVYVQGDKIIYRTTNTHSRVEYLNTGYIVIEDDYRVYENDYMTYFNTKTKEVTKTIPENARYSKDNVELLTGRYTYSCGSKKGIQKEDKVILNCEWSGIRYFDVQLYQYLKQNGKDYVLAYNDDGKYSLIDLSDSKIITTFNTSIINDVKNSTFIYYIDNSTKELVSYNLMTGQSKTFSSSSSIKMYANYIKVTENNQTKYYNMNLKLFYTE